MTPAALPTRHELLGGDWLARWERSQARFPSDVAEADRPAFEAAIREHPQFRVPGAVPRQ
jgi:queuine tRNA-ribosyltransferase